MDFDLDDLISSDAANNAKASKKFQPKAKPKPKPRPIPETQSEPKSAPTHSTQFVEAAATANNELIGRTEEEQPGNDANQISKDTCEHVGLNPSSDAVNSSARSETLTNCVSTNGTLEQGLTEPDLNNNIDACTNIKSLNQVDPLTGEEAAIVNDNDDFDIENSLMRSKDAETSHFWEPLDILSQSKIFSGPKVGKFKPKPKAQTRRVEQIVNSPDQDVMSFQYEDNIHLVPSQTNFMENKHVSSLTSEEILGSSSIRVTDSVPNETISDHHVNEEPINLAEKSKVDSVNQDDMSSDRLKRRSNKTFELIDESVDEGIDHDLIHRTEFDSNDGDYGPESESISERKGNKSKKSVTEKKKAVRKRKKASEVSDELNQVPKKKFSHSTRRNRRKVNPQLLAIPEDELDLHMPNIPMREIIRLAEHREWLAKKDTSTAGTPAMNQSVGGFSDHYDEHEAFAQGRGSAYEHQFSREAQNSNYYNYRTHMKIKPRTKWSKQETELFYEAVQQFGTDLSLITGRFPGRTREQIKLKYKREERQQPLRLNDALSTRAKGHSHFEAVIECLKQAQAQDSENDDDPMTLTDKEDEVVATDINETADATKPVRLEKEIKDAEYGVPSAAAAAAATETTTKSDDSEDDMYQWSEYKSEL